MNHWDKTKQTIHIDAADSDARIRQRLIELGWTTPPEA